DVGLAAAGCDGPFFEKNIFVPPWPAKGRYSYINASAKPAPSGQGRKNFFGPGRKGQKKPPGAFPAQKAHKKTRRGVFSGGSFCF
ncbi:hypothetical protein, partial [Allofournierella sp.]|uniref:hypothetical protein n=1 Tax=Allofournierella sp. TaxID=1940256 RepID=UPI002E769B69